jgi:hypothetical protein
MKKEECEVIIEIACCITLLLDKSRTTLIGEEPPSTQLLRSDTDPDSSSSEERHVSMTEPPVSLALPLSFTNSTAGNGPPRQIRGYTAQELHECLCERVVAL